MKIAFRLCELEPDYRVRVIERIRDEEQRRVRLALSTLDVLHAKGTVVSHSRLKIGALDDTS